MKIIFIRKIELHSLIFECSTYFKYNKRIKGIDFIFRYVVKIYYNLIKFHIRYCVNISHQYKLKIF